jgi:hypothetical protein
VISTVAIVAIVLVLIAGAGILFMTRRGDAEKNNNVSATEEKDVTNEPLEQPDQTAKEIPSTNEYYSLLLPAGWSETSEFRHAKTDAVYRYHNESGAKFAVYVNIANTGLIGDTGGTYEVIDNKFRLERNRSGVSAGPIYV